MMAMMIGSLIGMVGVGLAVSAGGNTGGNIDATIQAEGMSCSGCARRMRQHVEAVPGVAEATVDLEGQEVSVRFHPDQRPEVSALEQAVEEAGFSVRDVSLPARGR